MGVERFGHSQPFHLLCLPWAFGEHISDEPSPFSPVAFVPQVTFPPFFLPTFEQPYCGGVLLPTPWDWHPVEVTCDHPDRRRRQAGHPQAFPSLLSDIWLGGRRRRQ